MHAAEKNRTDKQTEIALASKPVALDQAVVLLPQIMLLFSRPLKGCKEGMARTTVQFAFDTSLGFLVWFFKKRRKVFE